MRVGLSYYSYQLITTLSYVRPNDPIMTTITSARQPSTDIFYVMNLRAERVRVRVEAQLFRNR
jgi:hypothetical protein